MRQFATVLTLAGLATWGCSPAPTSSVVTPPLGSSGASITAPGSAVIIDHTSAQLKTINRESIKKAIQKLVIAYGHTSHGSQIVDGLVNLQKAWGAPYEVAINGQGSGLKLYDTPFQGAQDLGSPDRGAFKPATVQYLRQHPNVNVVMWSWCGQCATNNPQEIANYLQGMSSLEQQFPKVRFVYMTGHLDGSGSQGALFKRSQEIRDFCRRNGKTLYDFGDIERYDPDGVDYLDKGANDNCDYRGGNWAIAYQRKHPDWVFPCNPAHSQPLNGNLKAYAAWQLFAKIAEGS